MQKEYTVSAFKITMGILLTSIVSGIGFIYSFVRISDTTTILVRANESDIAEVKAQLVPRSEWELQSGHTNGQLYNINNKLDSLLLR